MTKQFICIRCPKGCMIDAIYDENTKIIESITGNGCKRGVEYVSKEITNPERMLTSTVKVNDAIVRVLPVATSKEIPKGLMFEVMKEINKVEVTAPIKRGDIVLKNVCNTGADLIAQTNLERVLGE